MKAMLMIGAACLIMGLGGCGGSGTDKNEENDPSTKTVQVEKKSKVKKVTEGYTLDQYLNVSVLGLKPLMTIKEVRQELESKGFEIPTGGGFMAPSSPLGLGCDEVDRINKCRIGQTQSTATLSARTDSETGVQETVAPFFFLDIDGIEKLYSVKYTKPFADPIHPENMKDALLKRYGKANRVETRGDANKQELFIQYLMHANLPSGEAYDDVLTEQTVQSLFGETKAMRASITRMQCFNNHLKYYDVVIDERCSYLMGLDAYGTHLFFEAIKDARALQINVTSDKMIVETIGRFIPEAAQTWKREQDVREKIKELESRRNQKAKGLSDL
ncbi:MAG: hypothetical protein COA69_03055 [Robiginitomaculum sp.]|nr:MAG: hypothetical protein COA69_03055 [Robiginitomaculum sp.]